MTRLSRSYCGYWPSGRSFIKTSSGPICLVYREPVDWLVCFVPAIDRQWWHCLLGKYKHCYALRKISDNQWLVLEPWWSRIMLTTLTDHEAELFIRWGRRGTILTVREHIPGASSQLRGWMSCAALVAHLLGRNYMVWTPQQLLNRLQNE